MYGTDGYDTQAFGNDPGEWDFQNGFDHGRYAFAIPQLYGVLEKGDLSIKFGHFFTLVGYEVVPAPITSSTATPTPCTTANRSPTRVLSLPTR